MPASPLSIIQHVHLSPNTCVQCAFKYHVRKRSLLHCKLTLRLHTLYRCKKRPLICRHRHVLVSCTSRDQSREIRYSLDAHVHVTSISCELDFQCILITYMQSRSRLKHSMFIPVSLICALQEPAQICGLIIKALFMRENHCTCITRASPLLRPVQNVLYN